MSNDYSVAVAPNIAFIKYWGARDLERAIPCNPSISMTLRECVTETTVRRLEAGVPDEIWIAGDASRVRAEGAFRDRALAHLARLRAHAGVDAGLAVATRNNFPAAAGIASSASGFAALTVATVGALGLEPSPSELSLLARRSGSGSASRSVMGGYVRWPEADDPEGAAREIAPAEHWDLRDVVVLVQSDAKKVSSLEGHSLATQNPHFAERQRLLPQRLVGATEAIAARDFARLGAIIEEDAIELHCIAMTSDPPVYYWRPATLAVLEAVRELRSAGTAAWSTMDAGANVHVICTPEAEDAVVAAVGSLPGVEGVIRDGVGGGPRVLDGSLFEVPEA